MWVVVLKDTTSRRVWCRTVCALAAVSEGIKFVVSLNELCISAINGARTAHGEITFDHQFFHEYSADFSSITPEGYEEVERSECNGLGSAKRGPTYSFLVNSKHMVALFRMLDLSDVEYICLKVYWSRSTAPLMKYKLLIEIKTKKLVVKKYQTAYQPVMRNRLLVSQEYKQQHSDITYMKIDEAIPRQFLDMVPSAADDFKLEIRGHKVMFSGLKRAIVKDRDYLRQPMAVTVTLGLKDLLETNISSEESDLRRQQLEFRLRDFKTFMSLISSLSSSDGDYDSEDGLSVYLKNPGDPIVFELANISHVNIQFVQITNLVEDKEETKIPNHVVYEKQDWRDRSEKRTEPTAKRYKPAETREFQSSSPEPQVGYGQPVDVTARLLGEDWEEARTGEKEKYNTSYQDHDSQHSSDSAGNDRYGPTQKNTIKSIFD